MENNIIFVTSYQNKYITVKKITTVTYENNEKRMESVYSKRIRAGKRRTYFFDVRATRSNDYYLTITESRKKFNEDGYDRHKLFLYKEDFNKFLKALTEAVDYVKTDLMPDFDFDAYNHDQVSEQESESIITEQVEAEPSVIIEEIKVVTILPVANNNDEEVDKW